MAADGSLNARLEDPTMDTTSSTPYIALSHRWVKEDSYMLMLENYASPRKSIPVSLLKRSIRDALITTVSVGLFYLWVDSLCIIQDDSEDKLREISRTYELFSNAHCTIVADASGPAESGCFKERDPGFLLGFRAIWCR